MSLKMLGENESTAAPWIFIQCDKIIAPKVRKFFKQPSVESDFKPSRPDAYSPVFNIYVHEMPPNPPRSKLEPHRELIRELRREGRTYREISRLFAGRLGLRVAPSTLHSFIKVRARHRKQAQFELPDVELLSNEQSANACLAAFKPSPR